MTLRNRTAESSPAPSGVAPAGERRRSRASRRQPLAERLIAGVPARIMAPRIVFLVCMAILMGFGLLMVYSASSVESLKEHGSSMYFVIRQAAYMCVGMAVFAFIVSKRVPWRLFRGRFAFVAWLLAVGLLIYARFFGAGGDSWGATRWINLGFFSLQPSELAKPAVILFMARVFADYYEDESIDTGTFVFRVALGVGIPCLLIFIQPDMGTTAIIVLAVLGMGFLSGFSARLMGAIFGVGVIAGVLAIVTMPYRFERFLVFLNPEASPLNAGYQAVMSKLSFASGGLFGRGIGNSTIKYDYMPEAHNDYILSIIGEEVGLIGMVVLIAVFAALIVAGFRIARRSPSFHTQILAAGCILVISIQFLLNVLGVLNLGPMTGKPLPFISFGGSAIIASIMLAGIIVRVSRESEQPSAASRRRSDFAVMSEQDAVSSHMGRSTAGSVHVRSGVGAAAPDRMRQGPQPCQRPAERRGFSVYDGGMPRAHQRPGGGYERVNLNGDGSDRLRTDYGSRPVYRDERDGRDGRRSHPSSRRDRYDR